MHIYVGLKTVADLEGDYFSATAGEVIFADVLLLPNGMSKVGANA
jgi:hypothetical protein